MTRETKVGLLVGMGVILLVGIILTDHLAVQTSPDILPPDGRNTDVGERVPDPDLGTDPIFEQGASESDELQQVDLPDTGRPPVLPDPVPVIAIGPERDSGDSSRLSDPINRDTPLPGPPPRSSDTRLEVDTRTPPVREHVPTTRRDDPLRTQETTTGRPRFHTVQSGESLWKIAAIYYGDGRYYPRIKKANPGRIMSGDRVRSGVRLVIPPNSQSSPSSDRRPRPVPPRANTPTAPAIDRPATITIRSGDTLGELASRHLGSARHWGALLEANRNQLDDEFGLQPGMVLKLPGARPAPSAPALTSTNRRAIPADARRYTVEEGDTLWRIASERLGDGSRYFDIFEANRNRIADIDELMVGQTLVLP